MAVTATRYHDFSAGHRVCGHESKCALLHGHNYRVYFEVEAERLDDVGRVLDFSAIKERLCEWLEEHWDHKFLLWAKDPFASLMYQLDPESMVLVPFNPTAENMARYLGSHIGPIALHDLPCALVKVVVWETRKCSATWTRERGVSNETV